VLEDKAGIGVGCGRPVLKVSFGTWDDLYSGCIRLLGRWGCLEVNTWWKRVMAM
jgi:hypothetical protein